MLEPFLNYFRQQQAVSEELFDLCYLSAFEALPTAVQRDGEEFWKTYFLAKYPDIAWYTHLCLLARTAADPFAGAGFRWHKGRLPNRREYMVLEYPEPDPLDLGVGDFLEGQRLDEADGKLYPYFSAVLRTTTTKPSSCFCLSQSPVDGLTSLRRCRLAAHYNLGRGPEPTLEAFLECLESAEELGVQGAVVRFPDHLDEWDRDTISKLEEQSDETEAI